ncbi:MAG TPA: radical SAM protein, partial [Synergistaceae bacterium]|nr:radical SAM protein [Synergistaceae bacterium]
MQVPNSLKKIGIEQAVNYLVKNPEKNVPKLMDWVDRHSGENFEKQRQAVRNAIDDPENCYHQMMFNALSDLDKEV